MKFYKHKFKKILYWLLKLHKYLIRITDVMQETKNKHIKVIKLFSASLRPLYHCLTWFFCGYFVLAFWLTVNLVLSFFPCLEAVVGEEGEMKGLR